MFPDETNSTGSKALPILIAILAFLLIAGGIGWFYFNSKAPSTESATTTAPITTLNPKTEAKTEITGALDDIDSDLTEIETDEGSEDDTIDF